MAKLDKPCVILHNLNRYWAYNQDGRLILQRHELDEVIDRIDAYGYYIARKRVRATIIDKVRQTHANRL